MNAQHPLISIVIITWNRREDILETLSRLKKSAYTNYEIIVVDNNSSDGTVSAIAKKYPDVKIVPLAKNIGIAAKNQGVHSAKGEFIVMLDNDSHLEQDALYKIVNHFKSDPGLSVIGAKVINTKYNVADTSDLEGCMEPEAGKEGYLCHDFHGVGAAFRKSIFDKAGLFSEFHHAYLEENDLSLRILDSGGKIKYFPDVMAYHRISAEARSSSQHVFFQARNQMHILFTYFGIGDAIIQFLVRYPQLFLDNAIRDGHWWSFVRGLTAAINELPATLSKRRKIGKRARDYYMRFFWRLERYRIKKRIKRYLEKLKNIL